MMNCGPNPAIPPHGPTAALAAGIDAGALMGPCLGASTNARVSEHDFQQIFGKITNHLAELVAPPQPPCGAPSGRPPPWACVPCAQSSIPRHGLAVQGADYIELQNRESTFPILFASEPLLAVCTLAKFRILGFYTTILSAPIYRNDEHV